MLIRADPVVGQIGPRGDRVNMPSRIDSSSGSIARLYTSTESGAPSLVATTVYDTKESDHDRDHDCAIEITPVSCEKPCSVNKLLTSFVGSNRMPDGDSQ